MACQNALSFIERLRSARDIVLVLRDRSQPSDAVLCDAVIDGLDQLIGEMERDRGSDGFDASHLLTAMAMISQLILALLK